MAHSHTPPGALVAPRTGYTYDQLHGRACIVCGRDDGELLPDGHVTTEDRPGCPLPWAVAACPSHQGARA